MRLSLVQALPGRSVQPKGAGEGVFTVGRGY